MISKRIEVTRYYAYDGKEFDNIDMCRAYEQEKNVKMWGDIRESRQLIATLKGMANESRLRFSLAQYDAQEALNNGEIITFHKKMVEFYEGKIDYNGHMSCLCAERRRLNELMNMSYLWFGDRKRSKRAKAERRQKSLRWRQENTPDKWRTPNKIRVNKLQKEEQ